MGNEGDVFYDPEGPSLRFSDGVTPGGIVLGGGGGGNGWVRPTDWLAMPTVSETEEKFVGLFAVYNLPENFIALYFEGDYTVDWGDGTVEDFSSGNKAQHSYDWNDINSNTLTSQGYRQVLVTVTPQSGQNLTVMDLTVRHDNINIAAENSTPWLDLKVSMPNADTGGSLRFCGYQFGINENGYLFDVERIHIVHSGGMSDFTECFYYFLSLGSVIIDNCPSAEDFTYLFDYCSSLQSVSLPDTSSVTNMSSMFNNCTLLQSVSLPDTSSVTDMSFMFDNCYALRTVSLPDTSSVTNMDRMFSSCIALQSISLPDTSSAINMDRMFSYCYSLQSVSLSDTSSANNMYLMFTDCSSLSSVTLPDTSSVEDMYGMFSNCAALQFVSLSDTSLVEDMVDIFSGCNSLQEVSMTGTVTNISYENCLLGTQAIIDIFNNLGDVSLDPKTISIAGNYGVSGLVTADYDIATNKGWTVVD